MIWPPNVYLGKVVIVPNCELALSLPTEPKLARSFKKLIWSTLKKSSLEATQPTEAEGKNPNLLFCPKFVDPSLLMVNEAKYFSL